MDEFKDKEDHDGSPWLHGSKKKVYDGTFSEPIKASPARPGSDESAFNLEDMDRALSRSKPGVSQKKHIVGNDDRLRLKRVQKLDRGISVNPWADIAADERPAFEPEPLGGEVTIESPFSEAKTEDIEDVIEDMKEPDTYDIGEAEIEEAPAEELENISFEEPLEETVEETVEDDAPLADVEDDAEEEVYAEKAQLDDDTYLEDIEDDDVADEATIASVESGEEKSTESVAKGKSSDDDTLLSEKNVISKATDLTEKVADGVLAVGSGIEKVARYVVAGAVAAPVDIVRGVSGVFINTAGGISKRLVGKKKKK